MQNNEREAKGKISHFKITTSMTITRLDCTGLGWKRSNNNNTRGQSIHRNSVECSYKCVDDILAKGSCCSWRQTAQTLHYGSVL